MAYNFPIPAPPRTPSPLSDDGHGPHDIGLGIEGAPTESAQDPARFTFDSRSLSPPNMMGPEAVDDLLSPSLTATFSPYSTAGSLYSPITPASTTSNNSDPDKETQSIDDATTPNNPFNFTTQQYTAGRAAEGRTGSIGRADVGKRRGHKYKHSSVSHQIFLEPAPRAPLQLPASLPIPTRSEVTGSMTGEQRTRLFWCFCHFMIAAYVQWSAHGSLAMTALSRLLLFDAAGAVTCVVVDMMGNFEVWKRSSIKHPFGLERIDVLAGFGLAVFIAFMGLDVLSHGIQHSLENVGGHESHSAHTHTRVSSGSVDMAALLAIVSTIMSALFLKNHARIGKAMRLGAIAGWGNVFGNPSHFLTLSCSGLLLLLPLLSVQTYPWFDAVLSGVIAITMIAFGARLGTSLGSMLLMSYSGSSGHASVKDVIAEIETDQTVSGVDEARFWQVHYGLCMANIKLRYRGSGYGDEMARVRDRLTSLIRNRLGGGYGGSGLKWEVSIQLSLERD